MIMDNLLKDTICIFLTRRFGPLWGPPSSSCGGLVAFGHQMEALWPPWLMKLKFGKLCAPPSSSCRGQVAFSDLVEVLWAQVPL